MNHITYTYVHFNVKTCVHIAKYTTNGIKIINSKDNVTSHIIITVYFSFDFISEIYLNGNSAQPSLDIWNFIAKRSSSATDPIELNSIRSWLAYSIYIIDTPTFYATAIFKL